MPNRERRSAFSAFLYRYATSSNVSPKSSSASASAARYDKRDDNFLASVQLASIHPCLWHNETVA